MHSFSRSREVVVRHVLLDIDPISQPPTGGQPVLEISTTIIVVTPISKMAGGSTQKGKGRGK